MELANLSPKQLQRLSIAISESDETLAEFLGSLKSTLLSFPLDGGAFADELSMIGLDLFRTGVLEAAGASRVAHSLEAVPSPLVEVFLERVEERFATVVKREISIARRMEPESVTLYEHHISAADAFTSTSGMSWDDYVKEIGYPSQLPSLVLQDGPYSYVGAIPHVTMPYPKIPPKIADRIYTGLQSSAFGDRRPDNNMYVLLRDNQGRLFTIQPKLREPLKTSGHQSREKHK